MNLPPASIVIACYNDGRYLPEALRSALAADYPDVEIVIVDDGSTDPGTLRTLDLIQRDHPGVRVLSLPENSGLPAARNAGIDAARGDLILPLDCDNRILPHYLRLAAEALANAPEAGVVYGSIRFFGEQECVWQPPAPDETALLDFNYIDACAVFRKTAWAEAGGYEATLFRKSWEDWDLWLSLMERGWRFIRLDEVVLEYRKRDDSMSAVTRDAEIRKELYTHIYRRHAGLYQKHAEALLLLKAERDWAIKEQKRHIDRLHGELGEALRVQREIRWFLNLRKRVKALLGN